MANDSNAVGAAARRPVAWHNHEELVANDGLASHLRSASLFDSLAWFSCLARHGFGSPPALSIGIAWAGEETAEDPYLLWLYEQDGGKRLRSLTNHYSVRFPAPAGSCKPRVSVIEAFVDALMRRPVRSEDVELRNLPAAVGLTWQRAFTERGWKVEVSHLYWNWYAEVGGMSGAEYIAARPGRLRSTLRRKRKRVDEVHAVRFAICSTRQGLESALQDYERVYARSWKTPESAPSFIPHLAKLCADLGVLRLGLLYLDEQPVATQFWIVDGNNAVIYKLAHDHRYDALSVGSLLTEYLCRRAIDEDGVGEIDFGTGDEAYKRDWMTGRRQLVSVHAVNPGTLRGRFLSARWAVRDMLRKLGLRSHTPVDL